MSGIEQPAAVARIERALDRIEAALQRQKPPQDGTLAARHESLRTAATSALRDLDSMITQEEAR